jgi:hypothetical protein
MGQLWRRCTLTCSCSNMHLKRHTTMSLPWLSHPTRVPYLGMCRLLVSWRVPVTAWLTTGAILASPGLWFEAIIGLIVVVASRCDGRRPCVQTPHFSKLCMHLLLVRCALLLPAANHITSAAKHVLFTVDATA